MRRSWSEGIFQRFASACLTLACFSGLATTQAAGTENFPIVCLPLDGSWSVIEPADPSTGLCWVIKGPQQGLSNAVCVCVAEPWQGSCAQYVDKTRVLVEKEPSMRWLPLSVSKGPKGEIALVRVMPPTGGEEPYTQAFWVHRGWALVMTGVFPSSIWIEQSEQLRQWCESAQLFLSPEEPFKGYPDIEKIAVMGLQNAKSLKDRLDLDRWNPSPAEWDLWWMQVQARLPTASKA